MEKTSKQYDTVVQKCRELFRAKMKDYGSSWRILRLPSLTDQIYIKANRIRNLQLVEQQLVKEGEESEFIGILNYSAMALMQMKLGVAEQPDLDLDKTLTYFDEEVQIAKELMMKKNHDYGEAWREMRIASITDLILQKILRIKQIEDNSGKTTVSEGLEANYQDMLNYAAFSLILIHESKDMLS